MRPCGIRVTLAGVLAGIIWGGSGAGALAGESVAELLARVRARDGETRRWSDRTQHATVRIVDGAGQERRREIASFTKRDASGGEKTVVFLLAPPELRGTALLQWAHPGRGDERWLYLPTFKRTRQITAELADESFIGTDFSYRDLEILNELPRWTEKEAAIRLDGEERVAGDQCHVIGYRPRDATTAGYGGVRAWFRRDDLSVVKIELQGPDGAAAKVLALADIRAIGDVPTVHRLVMTDVKRNGQTVVEVTTVRYDQGLDDDLFTVEALERGPP